MHCLQEIAIQADANSEAKKKNKWYTATNYERQK